MEKRKLEIVKMGSNEFYFVDGFKVSEQEFYQIKIYQQLDDIEEQIKEINQKLKS